MDSATMKKILLTYDKCLPRLHELEQRALDLCAKRMQERKISIPAAFESRVKEADSLRVKMEKLISKEAVDPITEERVEFTDISDVWKYVRDVVGIRIALYSYHHQKEVETLIADEFVQCRDPQTHNAANISSDYDFQAGGENGEDGDSDFHRPHGEQTFGHYQAKHFQVKFKPNLDEKFAEPEVFVEIQLQPIHLQAWSDIEHDLIYKRLNGKPSRDERLMLDVIWGHQFESERLFQKLFSHYDERVANDRKPISSVFSLAKIVGDHQLSSGLPAGDKEMLSMLRLHDFLTAVGMNTKRSLDKHLDLLVPCDQQGSGRPRPAEDRFQPLQVQKLPAVEIMDLILSGLDKPDFEAAVETARAQAGLLEDTYRLKVVLSAVVCFYELFVDVAAEKGRPGTLSQMMRELYCGSESEEKEGVQWAFSEAPELDQPNSMVKVLGNRSIEGRNAKYPSLLWKWFEGLSNKSNCQIFDFVFRISRLGVFANFPKDCRKLNMYKVDFRD